MYIKERKIHRDRDCLLEWRVSVHKSVCERERVKEGENHRSGISE